MLVSCEIIILVLSCIVYMAKRQEIKKSSVMRIMKNAFELFVDHLETEHRWICVGAPTRPAGFDSRMRRNLFCAMTGAQSFFFKTMPLGATTWLVEFSFYNHLPYSGELSLPQDDFGAFAG